MATKLVQLDQPGQMTTEEKDFLIGTRNATGGGRIGTDNNIFGTPMPSKWDDSKLSKEQIESLQIQTRLFHNVWQTFSGKLRWAGFFILLIAIGLRVPVWISQTDGKNLMPSLNYVNTVIAAIGMAIFGGFMLTDNVEYLLSGMLVGALIMLGMNVWQHVEIAQFDASGPTSGPSSDNLAIAKRNAQLWLGGSTAVLFFFILVIIYYLVKWNTKLPKWD